jgi:hypothetical protein
MTAALRSSSEAECDCDIPQKRDRPFRTLRSESKFARKINFVQFEQFSNSSAKTRNILPPLLLSLLVSLCRDGSFDHRTGRKSTLVHQSRQRQRIGSTRKPNTSNRKPRSIESKHPPLNMYAKVLGSKRCHRPYRQRYTTTPKSSSFTAASDALPRQK